MINANNIRARIIEKNREAKRIEEGIDGLEVEIYSPPEDIDAGKNVERALEQQAMLAAEVRLWKWRVGDVRVEINRLPNELHRLGCWSPTELQQPSLVNPTHPAGPISVGL